MFDMNTTGEKSRSENSLRQRKKDYKYVYRTAYLPTTYVVSTMGLASLPLSMKRGKNMEKMQLLTITELVMLVSTVRGMPNPKK